MAKNRTGVLTHPPVIVQRTGVNKSVALDRWRHWPTQRAGIRLGIATHLGEFYITTGSAGALPAVCDWCFSYTINFVTFLISVSFTAMKLFENLFSVSELICFDMIENCLVFCECRFRNPWHFWAVSSFRLIHSEQSSYSYDKGFWSLSPRSRSSRATTKFISHIATITVIQQNVTSFIIFFQINVLTKLEVIQQMAAR